MPNHELSDRQISQGQSSHGPDAAAKDIEKHFDDDDVRALFETLAPGIGWATGGTLPRLGEPGTLLENF